MTINGAALDPAASYRITTNNFLADGGDDFLVADGRAPNRTTLPEGRFDIDSLVDYLEPTRRRARRIGAAGARSHRRHAVASPVPGGGGLAPPPPGGRQSSVSDLG